MSRKNPNADQRRLALARTTLRQLSLSDDELRAVAGGGRTRGGGTVAAKDA